MQTRISLLLNIAVSVLLGILFLLALDATRALTQPLSTDEQIQFELSSGSSLNAMAQGLKEQGLLNQRRDAYYIRAYGRLTGAASKLQAGEYRVLPSTNAYELLEAMLRGDVIQYSFTIVEGWTVQQVLQSLAEHPQIAPAPTPVTAGLLATEFSLDRQNPEGWLFPDTYHFSKGTPAIDLLRRAHSAMRTVLDEEWSGRADDLPYKSPYEALIMASIVEKETAVTHERQEIAGVFVRRLKKGMRLQTDPTVIYGMGALFTGNIRRADLRRATPYNTYTQYGLPPTPIALPGRASIHAALHPASGDSLYFVSKGDGSHVFSDTLEKHNAAVREYQLGIKKTDKQ